MASTDPPAGRAVPDLIIAGARVRCARGRWATGIAVTGRLVTVAAGRIVHERQA